MSDFKDQVAASAQSVQEVKQVYWNQETPLLLREFGYNSLNNISANSRSIPYTPLSTISENTFGYTNAVKPIENNSKVIEKYDDKYGISKTRRWFILIYR